MSLTDHDRWVIARARELAALSGIAAIRERAGHADADMALSFVFGEARHILGELADITERLAG